VSQQSFIISDGADDVAVKNTNPVGTEVGLITRVIDPAEGVDGYTVPSKAILLGASDGSNLQSLQVESSSNHNLRTSIFQGANEAVVISSTPVGTEYGLGVRVIGQVTTVGTKTNNSAVPGTNNAGTLPAVATTASPSYTDGYQVALSTDLSGALRVTGSFAASIGIADKTTFTYGTTTQSPTGGVYQDTAPTLTAGQSGVVRLTQYRAFHVNLRDASGNEYLKTNNNAGASNNNFGVLPAIANTSAPSYTDGYQVGLSTLLTGALRSDISSWFGSIAPTVGQKAAASSIPVIIASDQTPINDVVATGTITANGQTVTTATINGLGSAIIQITGTWTGTIQFEASVDGATFVVLNSRAANAATTVTSTTTNNAWRIALSGWQVIRVRSSAWTSGTATITFRQSVGTAQTLQIENQTVVGSGTFTVAGNKTNNNAAPGATNVGALVALANASTPSWTEGNLVALSTLLTGALRTDNSSWFGSTAPTVGQKTMANSIPVVIGSDQSAIPASQSGTWTVQQGTPPWSFVGNKTNNNATPGTNNIGSLVALANTAAPSYTDGYEVLLSTDLSGNLRIAGTVTANQGGTWTVQPGNTQNTTPWLTQDSADGPVSPGTVASKSILIGGQFNTALPTLTNTQQSAIQLDSSGRILVSSIANALPTGSNTIGAVTQASGPWTQNITQFGGSAVVTGTGASGVGIPRVTVSSDSNILATQSGTWTVQQGTAPWSFVGTKTNNNATPGTNNIGSLVALANTSAPSYTDGYQVLLSTLLTGALRTDNSSWFGSTAPTVGQKTMANSIPVVLPSDQAAIPTSQSGTWTVQQGSAPWSLVGTKSNNAVVPGSTNLGVLSAVATSATPSYTEGNQVALSTDLAGVLRVSLVSSSANPDKTTFTYGTTNDTVIGGVYQDTSPTLTAGQSGAIRLTQYRGLHVNLRDSNGNELLTDYDGRQAIDKATMLFYDSIEGTTVNTNIWTQSQSGMTQVQATGSLTLNSASSTTATNYSIISSSKRFLLLSEASITSQFRARVIPQANAVCEIGFGISATNAAPTEGVFFRFNGTTLTGVINFNGTETATASLTLPISTTFYNYKITIFQEYVHFQIGNYGTTSVVDITLAIPLTQGSPTSISHIPTYARVYNSGTPSSAGQIVLASCNVGQNDLDANKTWSDQLATVQKTALTDPAAFTQLANFSNSAAPSSATLSNTTAGYTTLGGLFQFAAIAGAETDYALFAFQVPTGYQLYITNISISTVITGAQSTTSANIIQWGLAANSSAVSLATTGSNPPMRLAVGMQVAPKAANVGDLVGPNISYAPKVPLVIDSGKYFHVIMRMVSGNATASQIFRGNCLLEGYFE